MCRCHRKKLMNRRRWKTEKHTNTHTHLREETGRTETTQAYKPSSVGILCAGLFVKHECTCYMKTWLTTSLLATQGIWCLRLWAHQNKILLVVHFNTEKCYSCNPMDFHAYVKQCKAWHDLYLMCPKLTSCWFVKYPSIDIVQWWNKRPMCRCYRRKLMNRRRWKKQENTRTHTQTHTHERRNRKNTDNSGIHTKPCRHIVCAYIRQTWVHMLYENMVDNKPFSHSRCMVSPSLGNSKPNSISSAGLHGKMLFLQPNGFHAYVKQCKAWHDLYLMCSQLTSCWFVKYPSIDIVQRWNNRPMCRYSRRKMMNRRRWKNRKTHAHTHTHTHEGRNRKKRDNSGIHTKPCRHIVCTYIRQTWVHMLYENMVDNKLFSHSIYMVSPSLGTSKHNSISSAFQHGKMLFS